MGAPAGDDPRDEPGPGATPWLFAYGTLGPADDRAAARDGWRADAVRGDLFDLGPYPALVRPGDPAADWVEGHVRPVTTAELLTDLDPYEGVDDGLFARVATTTRDGRSAWVYTYSAPIPAGATGPLRRWAGARRRLAAGAATPVDPPRAGRG